MLWQTGQADCRSLLQAIRDPLSQDLCLQATLSDCFLQRWLIVP